MRRFVYACLCVTTLLSCVQRQIIPDKELAQIFRDAFWVNAYTSVRGVKLDSLNIYEPIFESYGYTVEDVHYTIGNFSKRKSARLSDVVEGAIAMLEREGLEYSAQVAILDTVRAISQRRERHTIYERDMLLVESISDTTGLIVRFGDVKPGRYTLTFDYLIDSLDKNVGAYRTIQWFDKRDGAKSQESISYLQRGRVMSHSKEIDVEQPYNLMVVELVNFMGKKREPHIKLRDIKIDFTPTAEDAERLLFEKLLKLNIFPDELFAPTQKTDSL